MSNVDQVFVAPEEMIGRLLETLRYPERSYEIAPRAGGKNAEQWRLLPASSQQAIGHRVHRAVTAHRHEMPIPRLGPLLHQLTDVLLALGSPYLCLDATLGEGAAHHGHCVAAPAGGRIGDDPPAHSTPPAATTPRSTKAAAARVRAESSGNASVS